MLSDYPNYREDLIFNNEARAMETVYDAIRSIRNIRSKFNISPSIKVNVKIQGEEALYKTVESYLKRLARVENIEYINNENEVDKQAASAVVQNSKIIVPLVGLIDINEEINRQNKKLDKLNKEKASLTARINNQKFVESAPVDVVQKTKDRIAEIEAEAGAISELIKNLS